MTSPDEQSTPQTDAAASPVPPANVPKRQFFKWTVERNLLLMKAYNRFLKKEIGHKSIRDAFAKDAAVDLELVPQHTTLMNYISNLKKLFVQAADLHEDIDRFSRTPTEQERHKNLLSSKQKDLKAALHDLGVEPGDTAVEHDVYKMGNDLKLHKSLNTAAKELDAQKSSYKKMADEMATKIMTNPTYAREVRDARRKRPRNSEDEEDYDPAAEAEMEDDEDVLLQNKHKMAYCDSNDPGWASRRRREEFSGLLNDARLTSLKTVAERTEAAQCESIDELKRGMKKLNTKIEDKFDAMEHDNKMMRRQLDVISKLLERVANQGLIGEDNRSTSSLKNVNEESGSLFDGSN